MFRRTDPLAQELGLNEPEPITQSCENCVSYNDAVENACNYGYNAGPGMKRRYWILNKDDEIESRLDALYNTIQARDERIRDLEAQCAAMREVLERFEWYIENSDGFWMGDKCGAWALDDSQSLEYQVIELLKNDAGAALLERLKVAEIEAERYRQESQYRWELLCDAWNRGTELTKKLAKAEAERVEAVNLKEVESMAKAVHEAYCKIFRRQNGAEYWTKGDYDKLDELAKEYDRVTVRAVLTYLRDNNHIREAE